MPTMVRIGPNSQPCPSTGKAGSSGYKIPYASLRLPTTQCKCKVLKEKPIFIFYHLGMAGLRMLNTYAFVHKLSSLL